MLKNNLVSIVIPTYEMKGDGVYFLELCIKSILSQTYSNVEVIVTDHSLNSDIENVCKDFSKKLNIKYHRNKNDIGSSSSNINNGISMSSGGIVKILMQDDFFFMPTSLENIVKKFIDNDINWLVSGCVYGGKNGVPIGNMFPIYTENILLGNNRIGSPSVLTIKNENPEFFNPELIWMMDCEYYKRCYDKYGLPYTLNEHQVYITQHENQITNIILEQRKINEVDLVKKIYSI